MPVRPYRTNVLVTGPSGSGKSTLVAAFLEQLMEHAYQFCLIDPEGDYEELERAVVLGSHDRAPTIDEALDALVDPDINLVLNLLGERLDDRPGFLSSLLPRLQELRAETGRPHWLVVDRLNLKAQNLAVFAQIAEGVDDQTWLWHLGRGDYERWFRDVIKDEELGEVAKRVGRDSDAETSRREIVDAVSERYTMPAKASS